MSQPAHWTKRLASNSLLHFLIVGGLLYAIAPAEQAQREVQITKARLAAERQAQRDRLGQHKLTTAQRLEVDRRVLHDALLLREAQRLGLGQGDAIIRQRLVQKVLFLTARMAGAATTPGDDTLKRWHKQHPAQFRTTRRYRLVHIYFRRLDKVRIASTHKQVSALPAPTQPPPLGDTFPLPRALPLLSTKALARRFGKAFVRALAHATPKAWTQAIPSRYGWHLVWLYETLAPQQKPFASAKEEVRFHWILAQKKRAREALLRRLYKRYKVRVAGYKTPPFAPKAP